MKGMNNIAEYRIKYYAPISKPIFFLTSRKNAYLCHSKDWQTRVLLGGYWDADGY